MKWRAKTGMSISVMALSVLFVAMMLISCGGGGGGDGVFVGHRSLSKGAFTKTVNHTGNAAYYTQFFKTTLPEIRYMTLYLAQDMQGSGNIKSISFKNYSGTATAVTCPNVTVKIGHTNVSTLDTTYANNVEQGQGTFTTVLNNAPVTIPAGAAGDYFTVNLGTQFNYNGVDNLVVEVTRTAVCSGDVHVGEHDASPAYDAVLGDITSSTALAGTAFPTVIDMRFTYAGGDDAVEFGGAIDAPPPFASNWHTQMLYFVSEITGTGPITGIGLQTNATTTTGVYTYTLKLGHTTVSALTTTFADNFNAGTPSTIVTNGTITIPGGVPAGEYIWIPFPGTFTYNGKDNLIVDIDVSSGSALNYMRNAFTGSNRVAYGSTGTTVASFLVPAALHTNFRFNGGPIVKLSSNNNMNDGIFNATNPTWSTATLYAATDLGSAGDITSVACRLRSATTATSFAHFKVVMGHALVSTLSTTAALNFASQNTVFSGTYAVPAGLVVGDWVTVPLSSSFAYDGKSNLIVWMGNDGSGAPGATATLACMAEFNAARYPGGLGHATAGVGSATFNLYNWTTDIRMTIQK